MTDLIDRLQELRRRAESQRDHLKTEEATKNALVMPLLSALGYDVFDPLVVIPEFTADVGTKKGEKVDYAIMRDGEVSILIECKKIDSVLDAEHTAQLFRYFTVTEARFAVLTNGAEYRFFTDIEAPNRMDERPFFVFDLMAFEDHHIEELKKFSYANFSLDEILETASALKYVGAVKAILARELEQPSEAFVKFFVSQIYDGRITQQVLEQFTQIVAEARVQFINDQIKARFTSALKPEHAVSADSADQEQGGDVVTTDEELEAYHIVRAIVSEVVDPERVAIRDTKSYCGVLLDDNNRRPICRLHFNYSQKYLGVFRDKSETRIPIAGPSEIVVHAATIKATVEEYLSPNERRDENQNHGEDRLRHNDY